MGIDSTTSAKDTNTGMKEHLAELQTRYEASKVTLAAAKNAKLKKLNVFTARRHEYSSDPKNSNLTFAQSAYYDANKAYVAADQENDWLNSAYFNAILANGRMMA